MSTRDACLVAVAVAAGLLAPFVVATVWVSLTVHIPSGGSDMAAGFAALIFGTVGALVVAPCAGLLAARFLRRRAAR